MQNHKILIGLLACGVISGCNSSSNKSSAPSFVHQFAKVEADTAKAALTSSTPLEAGEGTSVGLNVNFGQDDVSVSRDDARKVSITANDNGGYDLQVGDRRISFTMNDIDPNDQETFYKRITSNGAGNAQNYYLWNVAGTRQELLDGDNSHLFYRALGYYLDPGRTGPDLRGYAIVGTETPDEVIAANNMTATYSGGVRADIYQQTIPGNSQNAGRTRLYGDLQMNADFAQNKISGTVTNLMTRAGDATDYSPRAGSITMEEAAISGNSYDGQFTSDVINGDYSGRFYGNDAQETAGTLTGEGPIDGVDHVGNGVFGASRDTAPPS